MSGHRVASKKWAARKARAKKYPPHDAKLAYAMLVDIYRYNDWNWRGEEYKTGWVNSLAGLTALDSNPILDPDYEFGVEDRLTKEELRWLL